MDDQRVGSALRAMRIRRKLRQRDLSALAGVPRGFIALIEHGRLETVSFGQIRAVARALDARLEGLVRWQGGDLDRLTNRGHAQMHEAMARWFAELDGWQASPEVSFPARSSPQRPWAGWPDAASGFSPFVKRGGAGSERGCTERKGYEAP